MSFSVLMSVYKKEQPEYLERALESVFSQSYLPADVVLIEDGELTPELYETIEKYQLLHPELQIYQFAENVKLGLALKKGLELCKYELVARMDTDDIAKENRFELQYEFMKSHPQVAVCGGLIQEFNDAEETKRLKRMPVTHEEIVTYAKLRNPVNHMTVMFRKSDVLAVGSYRHFPFLEDYDLWSRMLAKGAVFYNMPQILVKARTSDEMYGRRGGIQYCRQYLKLRKEQRQLGLLSICEYGKAVIVTVGITLISTRIRKWVYKGILRNGK